MQKPASKGKSQFFHFSDLSAEVIVGDDGLQRWCLVVRVCPGGGDFSGTSVENDRKKRT